MEQVPGAVTLLTVPIWHVVFQDTTRWWGALLRRGHGHCWAFGFWPEAGGGGRWVVFDPAYEGFQVRLATEEEVIGWLAAGSAGWLRVLRMVVPGHVRAWPRWCVTCAGSVAALLGLPETPLTPWQLACTALRRGAVEVRGVEPGEGGWVAAEGDASGAGGPGEDGRGVGRGAAPA